MRKSKRGDTDRRGFLLEHMETCLYFVEWNRMSLNYRPTSQINSNFEV